MLDVIGNNRTIWLISKIFLFIIFLITGFSFFGYKRIETEELLSIDSIDTNHVEFSMWAWHVLDKYSQYDECHDGWHIMHSYLESGGEFNFDDNEYQYIISFDHQIEAFVYFGLLKNEIHYGYPISKEQKGKVSLYRIERRSLENPYAVG